MCINIYIYIFRLNKLMPWCQGSYFPSVLKICDASGSKRFVSLLLELICNEGMGVLVGGSGCKKKRQPFVIVSKLNVALSLCFSYSKWTLKGEPPTPPPPPGVPNWTRPGGNNEWNHAIWHRAAVATERRLELLTV